MKIYTNATNPAEAERGYDAKATVEARVLIGRIHFDEGYREADKGETARLSPEDFDLLEAAEQVEPEQVAIERDARVAARAAKVAA